MVKLETELLYAWQLGFFKQQEQKYAEEISGSLAENRELQTRVADCYPNDLAMARLAIRPEKEASAENRLQAAYGKKYEFWTMIGAKWDVAEILGEEEPHPLRERLRRAESQRQRDKQMFPQRRKRKEQDWER